MLYFTFLQIISLISLCSGHLIIITTIFIFHHLLAVNGLFHLKTASVLSQFRLKTGRSPSLVTNIFHSFKRSGSEKWNKQCFLLTKALTLFHLSLSWKIVLHIIRASTILQVTKILTLTSRCFSTCIVLDSLTLKKFEQFTSTGFQGYHLLINWFKINEWPQFFDWPSLKMSRLLTLESGARSFLNFRLFERYKLLDFYI